MVCDMATTIPVTCVDPILISHRTGHLRRRVYISHNTGHEGICCVIYLSLLGPYRCSPVKTGWVIPTLGVCTVWGNTHTWCVHGLGKHPYLVNAQWLQRHCAFHLVVCG